MKVEEKNKFIGKKQQVLTALEQQFKRQQAIFKGRGTKLNFKKNASSRVDSNLGNALKLKRKLDMERKEKMRNENLPKLRSNDDLKFNTPNIKPRYERVKNKIEVPPLNLGRTPQQ